MAKKILGLIGILVILVVLSTTALATAFATGDVFASDDAGNVRHYTSAGAYIETLNTGQSGYITGMAFDASGNLYTTDFTAGKVSKFSNTGTLIGTFGPGGYSSPESILFNKTGFAYLGQAGTNSINKFDSVGNLVHIYIMTTEFRGTDWIELASDQCTLYYTSEGYKIKRFDVCTNTQLADFATLDARPDYALRLLPGGGLLVANSRHIDRLDNAGNIIQSYGSGGSSWFALNLDPDGKSFWSADVATNKVVKFDITSGTKMKEIDTGNNVYGVTIYGEITTGGNNNIPEFPTLALPIMSVLGIMFLMLRKRHY